MRILEVNDVSGTASQFTRGLRELGHDVELYQPTTGTYRKPLWFRALIPAIRAVEAVRMGRQFRNGRFDRLHIHYETFGFMAMVAALPYDLHCHGGMITHMSRPLSSRLIRLCLRRARRVFYSTPNLRDLVARYRPDASFVPNPIDTDFFSPNPVPPASERIRILSISKMDTTKGWDHILAVLEALAKRADPPEIFAFGFGTEPRPLIHRRVALLNEWGVTVLSRVDAYAMRELIRSSHLVIGQFKVGAVGLSELESLACGKPVCCRFDYDHIYSDPPPFLKSRSVEDTIRVLESILRNRERLAELGRQGRDWVVRHHSIESGATILAKALTG